MALNWIEEIVGELYQIKGYLVVYDVDFQMPKTEGRRVRGHSDIDVLAISNDEVVHVECQTWWGPGIASENREFERLKARFIEAPNVIGKRFPFLHGRVIKNRFVTTGKPMRLRPDGPWSRLQKFCSDNSVELVELNDILKELIKQLQRKYPRPDRVGKERSLTRFLLHLIHSRYLKESI